MLPVILALLAALGFALSGVFVRMAGPRVAVLTGTAVSVVASLTIAVIPAIVLELPALQRISIAGFLWILLAFVNYPLGRTLNYASVRRIGAARAAPLFSSSPLWSVVLAVAFLGERPNVMIIAGTVAIVAGVVLIVTERHPR
jgi:drug/metabolite transporter (DMT)-like permease